MLSAYAFLTLSWPLSGSAGSKADVDKGLDLVTLPDTCALFAFFVFFMLNLDAFLWSRHLPHHILMSYTHPALFIYIIC